MLFQDFAGANHNLVRESGEFGNLNAVATISRCWKLAIA